MSRGIAELAAALPEPGEVFGPPYGSSAIEVVVHQLRTGDLEFCVPRNTAGWADAVDALRHRGYNLVTLRHRHYNDVWDGPMPEAIWPGLRFRVAPPYTPTLPGTVAQRTVGEVVVEIAKAERMDEAHDRASCAVRGW